MSTGTIQSIQAATAMIVPPVRRRRWKKPVAGLAIGAIAIAVKTWPAISLSLKTVSTDDAYVNSHVTYLAPRVAGQVVKVFVDDNDRVANGANFKETQLSYLRIGQRVDCEVDMCGRTKNFEGRITGFTMGTGQTLALLPPQNATGNFVKIVQRLPVRIELTDYNADELPLFVGLSVTPRVYFEDPATGASAGEYLRPTVPLDKESSNCRSKYVRRFSHLLDRVLISKSVPMAFKYHL